MMAECEIVDVPIIVVDLDGTLIRTDLLVESFAHAVSRSPLRALGHLAELRHGKAALKAALAEAADLDVALLPYNQELIDWLNEERANGARLYLASAANERLVEAVADHLGIFAGCMGSTGSVNLSAQAKADRIRSDLGDKPFTYVGNSSDDLPVWRAASRCIAVNCPAPVQRRLHSFAPDAAIRQDPKKTLKNWVKLIRVRQYVKNALVAVPLFVSHQITIENIVTTLIAALAFSLCASSVYVMNDFMDVDADRRHPTKKKRPLASGAVPLMLAPPAAMLLLLAAFAIAVTINWEFVGVLAIYFALTTAYTLSLKRKMIIDSITLATLYTMRVFAGAAAIHITPSEWLLGFSLFIFSSLAFIKRYIELALRLDEGKHRKLSNRNYEVSDLSVVGAIAAACGFNAVTFLALYISSPAVHELYAHPQFLWFTCPVMMFWVGRNLLLAHRRMMDDDPVVFALTDKPSLICAAAMGVAVALATF